MFCRKIGVQLPFNINSRALTLDEHMHLCNTFLFVCMNCPAALLLASLLAAIHSFRPLSTNKTGHFSTSFPLMILNSRQLV